jgi:SAM-dependent methyltransferase
MATDDDGGPAAGLRVFHLDREGTDEGAARMVMLLDVQDAATPVVALRQECLDRLAPRPGETALDIGSGTGTVARTLAGLVGPDGRVLGAEPNARMRQVATERSQGLDPAPTWLDATADALPLEDGSVDVVWCERVFQHLDDPQAAAHEIARVLRPGGRAAVVDADHGSQVSTVGSIRFQRALLDAMLHHAPNPFAARWLPRQLRAAGLEVEPEVSSRAYLPPPHLLRTGAIMRVIADQAVGDGTITAEERDEVFADLERATDAGEAFAAVTVFRFVARRPGPDGG